MSQFNFQNIKKPQQQVNKNMYQNDQQQEFPFQQLKKNQNNEQLLQQNNHMMNQQQENIDQYINKEQPIQKSKTKLTKKAYVNGFQLTDIVWVRPSEGRHKYQVLVRYIDPEQIGTKRPDKSYQKVIKFGQKGVDDFIDPPYNVLTKQKNINKFKTNTDNPLHPNFYVVNLLNGNTNDIEQNFKDLKIQIFKKKLY